MGLDMYLYVKKYESVGNWDISKSPKGFYPKELENLGKKIFERNFMSKDTKYQVGYWRKANAIHKYFIDVCANGEDNCRDVYVSLKNAENLVNLCEEVMKDHNKAEELLPTCEGFFFGSTMYDDWYFEDIEYTIQMLKEVIEFVKSNGDYDIVYRASW